MANVDNSATATQARIHRGERRRAAMQAPSPASINQLSGESSHILRSP
jgi:hypothetical protein